MELDILFTKGLIYDGEGGPPHTGSLGVYQDKIIYPLEKDISYKAKRVIDISGLSISPGFINIHSHDDFPALVDGRLAGSLCQGITTEVIGNCGASCIPMQGEFAEEMRHDLLEEYSLNIDWEDLDQFTAKIDKNPIAINLIPLIGQGNLRGAVVGMKDRPASAQEMQKMKDLTAALMNQGAWGISSGLIYPPSLYADTKELIELCKTAASKGGFYATHMRSESGRLLEAVEEALTIGKEASIPVEISHLKAAGEPNWGKAKEALNIIAKYRKEGVKVQQDQYPYTLSATTLNVVLPDWAQDDGSAAIIARLQNPDTRAKILKHMEENELYRGDHIIISFTTKEHNKKYEGKRVDLIAQEENINENEFMLNLILDEKRSVGAIFLSMCEEDVLTIMADPYTAICTDSSAAATDGPLFKGKPHPRTYGSFPRVFSKYVRSQKLLSTAEAIRKMTTLPAQMLGLKNRGKIAQGAAADLVVFNEELIRDKSTIEDPHKYPEGIVYIIVNGIPVYEKGKILKNRPGKVLKKETEGFNADK